MAIVRVAFHLAGSFVPEDVTRTLQIPLSRSWAARAAGQDSVWRFHFDELSTSTTPDQAMQAAVDLLEGRSGEIRSLTAQHRGVLEVRVFHNDVQTVPPVSLPPALVSRVTNLGLGLEIRILPVAMLDNPFG